MSVTIVDIARELELSHTTVSRVLNWNDQYRIPEGTRKRVLEAARRMGYRPNNAARALVTGKTNTIVLFAEAPMERSGPHFARLLESVEQMSRQMGYRVVVSGDAKGIMEQGYIDGAVMLADPEDPLLDDVVGLPYVCVYSRSEKVANCISWSDDEGAYKTGDYLANLGHTRIAAIWGDISPELETKYDKVIGFRRAMQEAGIEPLEFWGKLSDDQFENGCLLTRRMLIESHGVTAVACRNDFIALGAMKAIRKAGLRVPEDVSVVGYNDTRYARYADPALTSVHTPIAEAGEIAVRRLVEMIDSGQTSDGGLLLPASLAVRESTAPPAK